MGDTGGKGVKVFQLILDVFVQAQPFLVFSAKGKLKVREEALAARNGKHHAAQFAQQLVPILDADTLPVSVLVQGAEEPFVSVRREFNSEGKCVKNPTQN